MVQAVLAQEVVVALAGGIARVSDTELRRPVCSASPTPDRQVRATRGIVLARDLELRPTSASQAS